ncbi:hypothetical protein B23_2004 [Geobacillus thermoleovorans B23]|nr:hypothetical protein B23_2004 [Geobacillus thermoleovorans B23]
MFLFLAFRENPAPASGDFQSPGGGQTIAHGPFCEKSSVGGL